MSTTTERSVFKALVVFVCLAPIVVIKSQLRGFRGGFWLSFFSCLSGTLFIFGTQLLLDSFSFLLALTYWILAIVISFVLGFVVSGVACLRKGMKKAIYGHYRDIKVMFLSILISELPKTLIPFFPDISDIIEDVVEFFSDNASDSLFSSMSQRFLWGACVALFSQILIYGLLFVFGG